MTTTYDAISRGAGHNGLILQAYLGKAGMKTLAIERRAVAGGARMFCTIGTNSSCQRRSVAASRWLKAANESMVLPMSVHHSSARPSLVISATLSSGSISCAPWRARSRSAYHGMAGVARGEEAWGLGG